MRIGDRYNRHGLFNGANDALYISNTAPDFVNRMVDVLKEFVDRFTQAAKVLVETIGELFDLDSPMEFPVKKSYPHTYPHYVDNSKFNSRGYPMTIRPCARSRC